ncbi:DUF4912 domain-containing protein [Kosmotoga pacifica]|uniref:DUF4912 domain-containing protein n=1 Tax=Kosmotoga pacifica TaxID=1330330 RepID=A0A0G2Z7Q1_9BACT|nr:DUF4912 domain-containing protein [Kosmotoga pacifica]AKI97625.1 hypothetical protein IX53_07125 [Kosmotoga pacifica]
MNQSKLKDFLDSSPSIQELRKLAKMLGLKLKRTMKKRDLIKLLKNELEKMEVISSITSAQRSHEEKRVRLSQPMDFDLPKSYHKDKLVLLPVNPQWVYVYWDFSNETRAKLNRKEAVLRLHDVTNIFFNGNNAHRTKEIKITIENGNWYFKVDFSDADYLAEIGYYESSKFVTLFRSNFVRTPCDHPKFVEAEKWINLKTRERRIIETSMEEKKAIEKFVPSSITSFMNPSSEEFIREFSSYKSGGAKHE